MPADGTVADRVMDFVWIDDLGEDEPRQADRLAVRLARLIGATEGCGRVRWDARAGRYQPGPMTARSLDASVDAETLALILTDLRRARGGLGGDASAWVTRQPSPRLAVV
jgi:hypothetical protein